MSALATMDAPVAMLFDPAASWRHLATSWGRPKFADTPTRKIERLSADLAEEAAKQGMSATETIDLLLRSEQFFEARRLHWADLEGVSFSPMTARKWIPPKLYQVARSLTQRIEAGVTMSNAAGAAQSKLAASKDNDVSLQVTTSEAERVADPMWFLRDPVLPDEVVQALLGATRQEAIRLTLSGLLRHGRFRSLTLAKDLAELWPQDIRRHLRVLASFRAADVSTDIIPLSQRVDIAAAYARQRAILDAIRAA